MANIFVLQKLDQTPIDRYINNVTHILISTEQCQQGLFAENLKSGWNCCDLWDLWEVKTDTKQWQTPKMKTNGWYLNEKNKK